ncbi:MAG: hypothetical protein H7A18_03840 [Sinobacteraceae bacterium]|nr:hypothetical protein [Nevskiaceae bacterium]
MAHDDVRYIHGPLISTEDPLAHIELLRIFGMTTVGDLHRDADSCSRLWGTRGCEVREVMLNTPGTPYGARLLVFDPGSRKLVRDPNRGFDADAPKVVDFYVPDLEAACARVEAAGWCIREPVAAYELPEGRFQEAHIWGPDHVVYALITGPAAFFARFATITDRVFSEPQSLSGPVSQLEPSVRFFEEGLGLQTVYRYGIADDSFRRLVGAKRPQFSLRAVNVGLTTQQPYIALIDYGLPAGSAASLQGDARPPHRGLLGATVVAEGLTAMLQRLQRAGGQIVAPAYHADIPGLGRCLAAGVSAPNGGWYQLLQVA